MEKKYLNFINVLESKIKNENRELVFVCIGTSKVIGDSLGPLVGSYLKKNSKLQVCGDLKDNICKKSDINRVFHNLSNKCVIVVDSAISNVDKVGEIFITSPKIIDYVGIKQDKKLKCDIIIKGVVSTYDNCNYRNLKNLKNVDFNFVDDLAKFVSSGICEAFVNLNH